MTHPRERLPRMGTEEDVSHYVHASFYFFFLLFYLLDLFFPVNFHANLFDSIFSPSFFPVCMVLYVLQVP
jgi:hypothetical protein